LVAISKQSHSHEDVAVIKDRTPQPGHAVNLHVIICGGNSEPKGERRRVGNAAISHCKDGVRSERAHGASLYESRMREIRTSRSTRGEERRSLPLLIYRRPTVC
jgi:hypothetical protein